MVWFDPEVMALGVGQSEGIEYEEVLRGTPDQAVEGLRRYEEWKEQRTARIETAKAPQFRVSAAESLGGAAEAEGIEVEVVTLPPIAGRPTGRKFGRLVHDILQHAGEVAEIDGLARVWGRRHAATDEECAAAASAACGALQHVVALLPSGAQRYRELPVLVRLDDGTIVDGRIDVAWSDGARWTVLDYKTDRRQKRSVGQVQLYGLALQKATGLPVRGILLEV